MTTLKEMVTLPNGQTVEAVFNPTKIGWTAPDVNVDGSPFTADELGGWRMDVDGEQSVGIPIGWDDDRRYEFPIRELEAYQQLPVDGSVHSVALRTVHKNGIASDPSNVVYIGRKAVPAAPLDFYAA